MMPQIALEIDNSNQGLLFEPIMTIIRRYQISDLQIPTFSLNIIELYPCSIKMILKTMRDTVRLVRPNKLCSPAPHLRTNKMSLEYKISAGRNAFVKIAPCLFFLVMVAVWLQSSIESEEQKEMKPVSYQIINN